MLTGRIKKWHAKTDIPKTSDSNTNSPWHAKHKKFAYKHRKKISTINLKNLRNRVR